MNAKTSTPATSKLSKSGFLKTLIVLWASAGLAPSALAQNTGINFPPTQGNTGTGAFLPGVYNWSYSNSQIHNAMAPQNFFNMMRLPINVETANSPTALNTMLGYVNQCAGHYAIICMFDTLQSGESGHGNGKPNSISAMGAAWAKVNAVFASYPNVHYEIFNEPFGYVGNASGYVSDMRAIISAGGLPTSKCILDGIGYASDINSVAGAGWSGDLAYHFYPTWCSAPHQTQSDYSNKAQADLGSWGQKTWITEFGANLGYTSAYGYPNSCYDVYTTQFPDVNCLRGLDDALRALRSRGHGVKGAFYWHGWNNGDTYDYWASWNSCGACKVRTIESND
jgi:hypothetical protein